MLAVADSHASAFMRTCLSDCDVPVPDRLRACYTVNHPELRDVLLSPRGERNWASPSHPQGSCDTVNFTAIPSSHAFVTGTTLSTPSDPPCTGMHPHLPTS